MTAYVLVGLAIVANVMNDIFNEVLNSAEDQFSKNVHRAGHFLNADSDSDAAPAHSRRCAQWRDLLHALLTYIFLVCAWVLFFRNYEACSCSYGITGVEDCDLERCVDTGGSTLSYREAVYEVADHLQVLPWINSDQVSLGLLATIDKLFDSIDRNGNGSLSFDEINEAEKKAALFYQES